jgi:hypothetical protein
VPVRTLRRYALSVAILAALIVALVALGAAGLGPLTPAFYQPISISANGGVTGVGIQPIPEGPPGPSFGRSATDRVRSLAMIEKYIPDPLPAPINQWFCHEGGDLTVSFGNGREVIYGPCYRPASIDHLWAEIIYIVSNGTCVPRCGPGGATRP